MVRYSRHRVQTSRLAEDDTDRLQTVFELVHRIQLEDTSNVAKALEHLAERAQSATMGAGAAIAISRENQMECIASCGAVAPPIGSRAEATGGLCSECVRTGLPQFCMDVETDPIVNRSGAVSVGARSILYVPLFEGTLPAGVLGVFSDKESHFTTRDVRVLMSIGREVARTLHWHPTPDAVMMTARAEAPQNEVAAPVLESKTLRQSLNAKFADVLPFPVAEHGNHLHLRHFAALLTVLILLGTGIGYLAVRWTLGGSSGRTTSQSTSTPASSTTTPAARPKLTPVVNPAYQPSDTPIVQAVSGASKSSLTTKVTPSVGANYLESVRTRTSAGHTLVSLYLTRTAQFQVHTLTNPHRLYVDLLNVKQKADDRSFSTTAEGAVQRFRVGTRDNKLRVTMDLAGPCTYVVRATDPSTVVVDILSDSLAQQ